MSLHLAKTGRTLLISDIDVPRDAATGWKNISGMINQDAAVLSWESGFLKIREKLCHSVDFFFQKNSTRTAREGFLPKEDQNSRSVLREVSPAAVIYHGGLITLPPVPLRYKDLRLQNLA